MIYLFWATCRPEMMKKTHDRWMELAVHPENVKTFVAVDNKEDAGALKEFDPMVVENKGGVVWPVYKLTKNFKGENGDIMIVPSDDFYPPQNWDMYLLENMEGFRGVLKVNDGHMEDIISIPILKYEAFEQMNRVIYHPAYRHMFCDKELHDTAQELGICKAVSGGDPEWVHLHPHYNSRDSDSHDKSNSAGFAEGKMIYKDRRYMTLQQRLEV